MDGQEFQMMLEDLPTEIILHIFSFLRIPDLVRIQKVSLSVEDVMCTGGTFTYWSVLWLFITVCDQSHWPHGNQRVYVCVCLCVNTSLSCVYVCIELRLFYLVVTFCFS